MSYSRPVRSAWRHTALYVDKILKAQNRAISQLSSRLHSSWRST
jgi:hypothetical protein